MSILGLIIGPKVKNVYRGESSGMTRGSGGDGTTRISGLASPTNKPVSSSASETVPGISGVSLQSQAQVSVEP